MSVMRGDFNNDNYSLVARWKRLHLQCRRHRRRGFDPWVGKIPWRSAWQPTPVFLPRESYEQKNLAGYCPWGCKESDTMEATEHTHIFIKHRARVKLCLSYTTCVNFFGPHINSVERHYSSHFIDGETEAQRG